MASIANDQLLKDKDVLEEINKHKWIESEKCGKDIGFERASREWIHAYAKQYLTEHPAKSAKLWIQSQPLYDVLTKEF
ncbi:MAG: hypothetical protein KGK03_07350 [Candidatus Omnitrophica bacterium]|nr:hypothetical protein [Candidatus Omnitrophota bacterium]MDE2222870.1 hypothetical protein [Candidatus Omnitrophota bacterium]